MPYATLLAHIGADPASDSRLALAVDLANQFEAKLIGVGAEFYRTPYYGGPGADYSAGYMVASEIEAVEANLKRAGEKFRSVAAAVREGSEWRAAVQFPLAQVAAEARGADLVITGHANYPGASDFSVALPGAVIVQTGRPVLMAAPERAGLNAANIIVAWKDTREARRAVSDALPFLQRAKTIELVEICAGKNAAKTAEQRLADVAGYLLRHHVKANVSVQLEEKDVSPADQFLDCAAAQKADLIVAGAYGHTRLQEWVFGGFTRALLAQTKRPVFFSH